MRTSTSASYSEPGGTALQVRPADSGITPLGRSADDGFTSCNRSAEHGFTSFNRSAEHGFTSFNRSAEHGFTLLEMLVALAIFSLAGLALVRLQAVAVRTAADLDARVLAEMTARNIALGVLTDPVPPPSGASEGDVDNAGRRFHWRQLVAPAGDRRILRVTVRVAAGPGESPAVLTIARAAK